ncbi:hypothetical protein [Gaoshiqia sp. Z1-71]|uniref:hypothetical protein n=1 Tax=Gaoshiqia hydrogeniformans TaxID=3290090 RepID=UPI003BF8E072
MPVLNEAGIDLMLCGHIHRQLYIGRGEANNNFPILINANDRRAELLVSSKSISIKLVNTSGFVVDEFLFRK